MSYFSQMVALVIHNFVSAATGSRSPRRLYAASCGIRADHRTSGPTLCVRPIICSFLLHVLCGIPRVTGSGPRTSIPNTASEYRPAVRGSSDPVDSARTDCITGSDQDDRHERRRLSERQLCGSFENPTPLSNSLRCWASSVFPLLDLLVRPNGEKPEARVGDLGGDAHSLPHRFSRFAFHYEQAGNPIHQQLGVSAGRWEYGRQGGSVWDIRFIALRHSHD